MTAYHVKKGYDLPLAGEAALELKQKTSSKTIALNTKEFKDFKFKLLVREGDSVKVGTAIAAAKHDEELLFTSPVAGKVSEIVRGERRALQRIIIEVSGIEEAEDYGIWDNSKISSASAQEITAQLKKSGLWYLLRQRPFDLIADSAKAPKAIFINAMDSAPLAANQEFLIQAQHSYLKTALAALAKLTAGKTHVCYDADSKLSLWSELKGVETHSFSGKHPKGLVGTHIFHIDPINKGETVWYLTAKQAALIGEFLSTGRVPATEIVAVAGSNASERKYYEILRGAKISDYLATPASNSRVIMGSALNGEKVSESDYTSPYASLVTVLPEGDQQYYLLEDKHWAMGGAGRFTLWNLFLSRLAPKTKKWELDTNAWGDHRAIVTMDAYDKFVAQDIHVNFLAKAILSEDIEKMEQLGLYELSPEDVALCTFVCPSKTDFSAIVEQGLETLKKEG